jgi:hypothetical protein
MLSVWLSSLTRFALPLLALLLLFELSARGSRETTDLLNALGMWAGAREIIASIVAFGMINLPHHC